MNSRSLGSRRLLIMLILSGLCVASARAADWPTWRYDAARSAVSPESLPAALHLAWSRQNPPLKPAWSEDSRLGFDAHYEPIVVGNLLFVSSSQNDTVTALDTETGEERWRFYAGGPVRLAPVGHDGRLYFGGDDGNFYCLEASTGRLVWKLHVALGERHVLGNERLISAWPVRGGAVVVDGKVYFTVGVWPFEGTALYVVDAATGGILRSDDVGTPPDADDTALTDLSPQGYLAASGGKLFIPCGRSKAACFDISASRLVELPYDVKGFTDYHVTALGPWLFHGGAIFNVDRKEQLSVRSPRPVASGHMAYSGRDGQVVAHDMENLRYEDAVDRKGNPFKRIFAKERWRLPNSSLVDDVPKDDEAYREWLEKNPLLIDIQAGERLYGHQAETIFAIDIPKDSANPVCSCRAKVEGHPATMLAADGRLFVVTREGAIHCYTGARVEPRHFAAETPTRPTDAIDHAWATKVTALLDATGSRDGYCLVLGIGSGRLIEELVRQSELRVIALDPDAAQVDHLREQWDQRGLYGSRVVAQAADPISFSLPPYLATVIASEDLAAAGFARGAAFAREVFHALRPYGGTACLELSDEEHVALADQVAQNNLPNAELARRGAFTTLTRAGALIGSADWTHEYGDPGNTLMSRDELVRAPLGLLWFGGPSSLNDLFFDRHEWGPSMAVIDGRIFINGPGKLTSVDVYTGRILWQIPVPEGRGRGRQGNFAMAGYHFVATHDAVYLVQNEVCLRIDPATGAIRGQFTLGDQRDRWGRIRIWQDVLVAEVFRAERTVRESLPVRLVAMNRHSGVVQWTQDAQFSFPMFAMGNGLVFCFDGHLEKYYRDARRKGLVPKAGNERYLVAFNALTGEQVWRVPTELIVTWMSFSESLDVLVVSNKDAVAAHQGTSGLALWRRNDAGQGFGGHPESVWDKVIIWNDQIIDQRGPGMAYFLETGDPITREHPITGQPVAWEFTKQGHHCNYAIACQHLLTFRAAEAGFFDMLTGGTGRLRGFRAGCRNSLLPANGVLNAPNFASGCVCSYSLFTSLAMVHVPQADLWTYSALKPAQGPIERVGINFGAPGDRQDPNGSLWLDYPSVGGSSPDIAVEIDSPNARWFRHHASQIAGDGLTWVAASGVEGIRSVRIPLGQSADGVVPRRYTVRLYFADPDDLAAGARIFDVALQGATVLDKFDIVRETGAPRRMVVREFDSIEAKSDLTVAFTAHACKPLICGVEIVAKSQ